MKKHITVFIKGIILFVSSILIVFFSQFLPYDGMVFTPYPVIYNPEFGAVKGLPFGWINEIYPFVAPTPLVIGCEGLC